MAEESELLLYSLNEFREVIQRCLEIVRPQRLLEVGGEAGHFSRTLVDWSDELGFEVLVVEPYPSPALRTLADADRIQLIEGKSPEALAPAGPCDVYLLDGDHNYSTLAGELAALVEVCADRPFLALLHDVGWPNARRDMYYGNYDRWSSSIPGTCVIGGAAPGEPGVVAWGFRGEGDFSIAREEGGPRNGVLSAVETFLESTPGYRFFRIPCLFGLGVLFPADAPWAEAIEAEVAPFHENPLLARMEQNRLDLFVEILRLQDSLAIVKRELETLRSERDEEIEDLSVELLKMLEALAVTTEPEAGTPEVEEPTPAEPAPLDKARRVLSYDLYRAQVKARRVGSRVKQNLAGR